MKYKVSVIKSFSSAHFLRQYKGKCENIHGHNWQIKASFCGSQLLDNGMLIDFTDIKVALDKIMLYLDHKCLNEIKPFDDINPTAENLASFIFAELKKSETSNAKVCEIEVWESPTSSAIASH
jgi:6-pyruvoyltetrahydropterin/6-carboxytetrahydropterin synthase